MTMPKPKVFTGLENLNVSPTQGLIFKTQTPYTPYPNWVEETG